ncbi:MAG: T9SS type A sorting domain-containing protein [Chitinophagaceae bacterium]
MLPPGAYFIRITTNKNVYTKGFLKQ